MLRTAASYVFANQIVYLFYMTYFYGALLLLSKLLGKIKLPIFFFFCKPCKAMHDLHKKVPRISWAVLSEGIIVSPALCN